MIASRIDRLLAELPPPSDPDPDGASIVQELLGGRFGEMSTFLNYTFQSFNFRNRQGARPFYDLLANIAAEEFAHVELVCAAINTMLTGAQRGTTKAPAPALSGLKGARNAHHFLAGGLGAVPQDSMGRPWNGDYVFSSGDLIEDLTHNYFLETGARSGKLRVYETVEHPAARALTGYLLVRGGVHQIAYARAVEKLTGADLTKMFPTPRIPTAKIPECQPHIKRGDHRRLYLFSPEDYKEIVAVFNGQHPETAGGKRVLLDAGVLEAREPVAGSLLVVVGGTGEHGVDRRCDDLDVPVLLGRDVGDQVIEGPRALAVTKVKRLKRVVHQRRHLAELAAQQLLDGGGAVGVGGGGGWQLDREPIQTQDHWGSFREMTCRREPFPATVAGAPLRFDSGRERSAGSVRSTPR